MQIRREEIRTGLLVLVSIAIITGVLLAIGVPGVFRASHTYRIYFDNAGGLNEGAAVNLAGRKIGTVTKLFSPVPLEDRPKGYKTYEALVEVEVDQKAEIYRKVDVHMLSTSLLGQEVIDFTNGVESSGLAPEGAYFIGIRAKDFTAAISDAVDVIKQTVVPVAQQAQQTMKELSETADNLRKLTAPGSDVDQAVLKFRQFGTNLVELSSSNSALQKSLDNVETLTGPGGHLNQSLSNVDRITSDLVSQDRINKTLTALEDASSKLDATVHTLGPQVSAIGTNLEEASNTIKRQPWRLIWPSTKNYPPQGSGPLRISDQRRR